MNDENELLEPLATEAGQQAIARAINNLSSLEYAVRAERAATTAIQKADEASNSADDASDSATEARNWATKTDGYVSQETITIPPEQEGDEPTTETIDLYSARYYAALAQDIYNNLQFDTEPTEDSIKLLSSGAVYDALATKQNTLTFDNAPTQNSVNPVKSGGVYSALDTKADKSTTYTKTEVDTALSGKADQSTTYTKTEVDTTLSNVQSTLTFDNVPTANSDNPVKSSGIKTALDGKQDTLTFDSTPTANSTNPVTSGGIYTALQNVNIDIDDEITEDSDNPVTSAAIYEALQNIEVTGGAGNASGVIFEELYDGGGQPPATNTNIVFNNNWTDYDLILFQFGNANKIDKLVSKQTMNQNKGDTGKQIWFDFYNGSWYYSAINVINDNTILFTVSGYSLHKIYGIKFGRYVSGVAVDTTVTQGSSNVVTSGAVYDALQNYTPSGGGGGGSSITVDSTITQGGTNPVQGGAIYTALEDKADKSTTYTKTEVDTALSSKGDVTTNTDQNITGTKTFVGSKKVAFKQSAANDKLGFTLYSNSNAERGYLEFNPTNTIDGVAGLMTLGNYATSAASLTQVGFRRYSNISGQSGAYNLLMPMVADARTPFSLTTTYQNFYLPLGFKNGSTIVKTDKSGVVDISSLLASLEARVAALEGN